MSKKTHARIRTALGLAALLAASAPSAQAALLVYEGFTGYSTGELNGQAASSSSIGLSGAWDGSSYTVRHQVISTGLTFNGLATSGGALSIGNAVRLSGIAMSHAGVAAGGTLYSSYLVNLSGAPTAGSGITTRINGTSTTQASGYFNSFADGRNGTTPSVGYDSTFNPANNNPSSTALTTGTTYIVISMFTNVGNDQPGDANLYVLNQAQYSNLLSLGISNLASLSVGTGNNQVWAAASQTGMTFNGSFDSSDFLHILSLDTTSTIDEIRYGTTLGDVLPIPEPSAAAVAGLALLGMIGRRKRTAA